MTQDNKEADSCQAQNPANGFQASNGGINRAQTPQADAPPAGSDHMEGSSNPTNLQIQKIIALSGTVTMLEALGKAKEKAKTDTAYLQEYVSCLRRFDEWRALSASVAEQTDYEESVGQMSAANKELHDRISRDFSNKSTMEQALDAHVEFALSTITPDEATRITQGTHWQRP